MKKLALCTALPLALLSTFSFAQEANEAFVFAVVPRIQTITVEVREVDQVDGGEELDSPYINGSVLSLDRWAHDSLALALPTQVICRPQCLGLCPTCGIDLNADPSHEHEADKDPRWSKLDELKFD